MSKLEDVVFSLCENTVNKLGYELVEVRYAKEQGDDYVLTLFIYNEQGISLNDCEKVSTEVEVLLDNEDPIKSKYILSVSSLGLDRPIKTDGDFNRNKDKKIRIKLYTPKDGKKEYVGVLTNFDDDSFTILSENNKQLTFLKKEAAKIVLELEF